MGVDEGYGGRDWNVAVKKVVYGASTSCCESWIIVIAVLLVLGS